jgi:hypothetical protein
MEIRNKDHCRVKSSMQRDERDFIKGKHSIEAHTECNVGFLP